MVAHLRQLYACLSIGVSGMTVGTFFAFSAVAVPMLQRPLEQGGWNISLEREGSWIASLFYLGLVDRRIGDCQDWLQKDSFEHGASDHRHVDVGRIRSQRRCVMHLQSYSRNLLWVSSGRRYVTLYFMAILKTLLNFSEGLQRRSRSSKPKRGLELALPDDFGHGPSLHVFAGPPH